MRRFPKDTAFQQQIILHGRAGQEEYLANLHTETEEQKELFSPPQRFVNKRFL
ncbi:hypothetical protein ACFO25_08185 [Paenactinomyces guangxiensis]|uniref:Uncharacterized protein n=1 Tax=Paenactinomyces guangxiensis TaxID=1490290 RepID=A0A7W2A7N9_9BACL|nr:hypothetical protein [Paenactinomyces guangxiensis]MBA4492978.1 hypothetical protein [Paenactinomyces guangxiensis]MBH8590173.1 hypothetical protein [Paenactinomyces guangxiensis]